jgi:hypothetical protein
MAGRWQQRTFIWGVSLTLHGSMLSAAALMVIDFQVLPKERPYVVSSSNPQAPCFLEPELRRRDLSYRDGRSLRVDPDPQPCLEACDSLDRSVPGEWTDPSLRCTTFATVPTVYDGLDDRPIWRQRYESWRGLGGPMPLHLCRSSVPTEGPMLPALRWLARHQNADGGWSANGFSSRCPGVPCFGSGQPYFDEAVTSLALLCFMAAGYSSLSKDTFVDPAAPGRSLHFGETVKKGLKWLMSRQDPDGCIGVEGPKFLYNHAIATLAFCEAYGMTASSPLKEPSQKAVDFLVAARNPGAGWRYGVRDGETDTSVTGWALMALKSAELAELNVPVTAVNEPLAWLVGAVQPGAPPSIAYRIPESGPSTIPSGPVLFADVPCMTAVGDLLRPAPTSAADAAARADGDRGGRAAPLDPRPGGLPLLVTSEHRRSSAGPAPRVRPGTHGRRP